MAAKQLLGASLACVFAVACAADTGEVVATSRAAFSSMQWQSPYQIPYANASRTPSVPIVPGGGIATSSKMRDGSAAIDLDLWTIGSDGKLWNLAYWRDIQGWTLPPQPAPPNLGGTGATDNDPQFNVPYGASRQMPNNGAVFVGGGGVAANSRLPDTNDVWAIGYDGALWNVGHFAGTVQYAEYTRGEWHAGASFLPGSGIAAVSRDASVTDTFVIGIDGCLWKSGGWLAPSTFFGPARWPSPGNCPFVPGGGVAANSRLPSIVDTWAIASDGTVWNAGWWDSNTGYHAPYPLPIQPSVNLVPGAPLAAVSRDSQRVELYSVSEFGDMWMIGGWASGVWLAPHAIPTSWVASFRPPTQGGLSGPGVAANSRQAWLTDTWAIAPDGTPWNAGNWNQTMPSLTSTPPYCPHPVSEAPTDLDEPIVPPENDYEPAYARYFGPWTNHPTRSNASSANVRGTDSGAAFEASDGQLAFLFGDTTPIDGSLMPVPGGIFFDALGRSGSATASRSNIPPLTFVMNGSGTTFESFSANTGAPGVVAVDLGRNNIPQDGVNLNGTNFVFLGNGAFEFPHPTNPALGSPGLAWTTRSILAQMPAQVGATLLYRHAVATDRFRYVSAVSASDSSGSYVYVFGTNRDGTDQVYLARTAVECLADRSSWTYYQGTRAGIPVWGGGESSAVSIIGDDDGVKLIGEFNVRWVPALSKYVMVYQGNRQDQALTNRAIHLRVAPTPSGPWSKSIAVVGVDRYLIAASDPPTAIGRFINAGYGTMIHSQRVAWLGGGDDGLGYLNWALAGDAEYGSGEYAPFIVPRWSTTNGIFPNRHEIVLGVSSFVPYQVHLVGAMIVDRGSAIPARPVGTRTPANISGWPGSAPSPFTTAYAVLEPGGALEPLLSSKGNNGTGQATFVFTPGPSTAGLCFRIWGRAYESQFDHVSVRLTKLSNGATRVLRESAPRQQSDATAGDSGLRIAWDLGEFVGEQVSLVVNDASGASNGFIQMSSPTQVAEVGMCP